MTGMIKAVCEIIKAKGATRPTSNYAARGLNKSPRTPKARTLGAEIMQFLDAPAALARPGETLLAARM